MLEVRNLTKIYKSRTKGGVDTRALDGVSLRFPEKGMVFLLGKSGSGKSTLLNVCGGLDAPTDGEIIVKGRSSKDFSQGDFDSYRNTFVGFIFQEYNILNEFSVEDNIALALELQGKPKDKKAISELLEQVDLQGFAKRKPNTLSGGQKQRIAIARALIKSPEIIMADEPTGALDSNTGKQVFDTLKKLSRDKLVLVVSHDRDFAEQYGDRIIELKDGKVLSDVSKTEQKQEAVSQNVSAVGDVLCVKSDEKLSDEDFAKIKSFLEGAKGEVIIAKDEKDVATFKKASRITDDGAKEVFVETDESKEKPKSYTSAESRFIRSKLPIKHASKIGLSSLKSKPVRLVLTILLCAVSFILFGLLSTLNFYDSEATFKQTLSDSEREYVMLDKETLTRVTYYHQSQKNGEYDHVNTGYFSAEELRELEDTFGEDIFGGMSVYTSFNVRSRTSQYWNNNISTVAYLPEGNSLRDRIDGDYPSEAGEICISSYTADVLTNCQAVDGSGNVMDLSSRGELIGKTVNMDGQVYRIVGIFESGQIDPKFETLKNSTDVNYSVLQEFEGVLADGLHQVLFVSEDDLQSIANRFGNSGFYFGNHTNAFVTLINERSEPMVNEYPNGYYEKLSSVDAGKIVYFDESRSGLSEGEALVSFSQWVSIIQSNLWKEEMTDEERLESEEISKACSMLQQDEWREYNSETQEETVIPITEEHRREALEILLAYYEKEFADEQMTLSVAPADNSQLALTERTYDVVGLYVDFNQRWETFAYLTDEDFDAHWAEQKQFLEFYEEAETKYVRGEGDIFTRVYAPFHNTSAEVDLLWAIHSDKSFDENDSRIGLGGNYIDMLDNIDSMVKDLSTVFFYVGLVFAVFAILLFSNFISVSISQKKREIGILRAVGARGTDVFKIFFSESFVIALICVLLSSVGCVVICGVLNTELASALGASIFVFGIASFLVVVGVALLTAVIATFLPVWNAAKKKPVDSIRAL